MKGNPKTPARRQGILAGGNWIIDQVKMIDAFPKPESLANISRQSQGTGGSPYNVLIDLAKLGAPWPLHAAGLVGQDPLGQAILEDCRSHRIQIQYLETTAQAPTSYTDVMTEQDGGRRTFFHLRGANALWTGKGLDFHDVPSAIFHLGYLLLLDSMDAPDPRYGTRAARLLASAQKAGLKTCVDVVSENSDRFKRIVQPALQHVDYCILNELEAGNTTGLTIRKTNGKLDLKALRQAGQALLRLGVRALIVIHFPEGAYACQQDGSETWQSSLHLPKSYIAGSAGAGDAFCAGVLLGLHDDWELSRCLQAGVCAAAASLAHPTCTGGIKSLRACLQLAKKFGFRPPLHPSP